jgi:CRISPR-associated endonuclease/helicase Cas3
MIAFVCYIFGSGRATNKPSLTKLNVDFFMVYIAHVRKSDKKKQTLEQHLYEVKSIAGDLADKIGQKEAGKLIGLLHDFGKYSKAFQDYLGSATGLINPDGDADYVDAKGLKGKIDHSSAGAQWIWQRLKGYGEQGKLCAQILSLCIASHHSGLIDCLKVEGGNDFIRRMDKPDEQTHLQECLINASTELLQKAESIAGRDLLVVMLQSLGKVFAQEQHRQTLSETIRYFYLGLWTRFLFSCLIDADRINSADFEQPENEQHRQQKPVDWQIAIDRAESFFDELKPEKPIDHIRQKISQQCLDRANDPQGIYTLTVPTGGGKTYASLRYALHHAKKHQLDRTIYVIPFTSIIEQNAQAIREVLECSKDVHPWVLEHHSNLEPENQTWQSKLTSENWDAPIVLTTMVQFLEVLFSGGTRSVRRMHQLANSLIIFDEIQTLPIKCVHLFCNALNFLVEHAHTSALLCTATQRNATCVR